MPPDDYVNQKGLEAPARRAFDAFAGKSDTAELQAVTRAIYTGSGGDLKVTLDGDTVAVVIPAVPAGSLLPLRVKQLWATGTTVTNCIGLY